MVAGRPSWLLAELAGYPHQATFSSCVHARRVKATAAAVARLQNLAQILQFEGAIFLDEPEED
jgi:hypothetical protein